MVERKGQFYTVLERTNSHVWVFPADTIHCSVVSIETYTAKAKYSRLMAKSLLSTNANINFFSKCTKITLFKWYILKTLFRGLKVFMLGHTVVICYETMDSVTGWPRIVQHIVGNDCEIHCVEMLRAYILPGFYSAVTIYISSNSTFICHREIGFNELRSSILIIQCKMIS